MHNWTYPLHKILMKYSQQIPDSDIFFSKS